jgi:hypothetical protein
MSFDPKTMKLFVTYPSQTYMLGTKEFKITL